MATPSRRDEMIKNLMHQHRKKYQTGIESKEEKPKDPEAIKEIIELWKKSQEKKK